MKRILCSLILISLFSCLYSASGFYDPNIGRWVNRDPIGERGGVNLFGYVGNRPVSDLDPYGLDNCFNPCAGQNAPPSMHISRPSGGGKPSVTYPGGGLGDPFIFPAVVGPPVLIAIGIVGSAIEAGGSINPQILDLCIRILLHKRGPEGTPTLPPPPPPPIHGPPVPGKD